MKLLVLFVLIITLLVDISLSAPGLIEENAENINYRLNTNVKPSHYDIELTPHFEDADENKAFTFDGIVTITLRATEPNVKEIVLHTDDLVISEKTLNSKSKYYQSFPWLVQRYSIFNDDYNKITNKYTLVLGEALDQNKEYELHFKYTGKLRTDMHGFYRSSYKEGETTKWLASTQMQPVHARKVFPCFDEPSFKATFSIIINRPSNFKPSLSNTHITVSELNGNLVREIFEKTPKMSTYLVAFIVSEFDCRENVDKNFYVCSRPNAYDQTEYSFDVGQRTLKAFSKLFDYEYYNEISKMAMAAIPDFDAGAMENWGLLTYRETALLYDEKKSTALAQQRVAAVVAHEQTHMWFGDLVTCDWWSNTWLNEGFARFFQYFGTALVEDTWGLDQQFVVDQLQFVMAADSLENTKALTHEVNTPDEIADRFSSISYNKGASVIRMFEHTLGKDNFIIALQNYLKANKFSTSLPEKLYAAFQDVIGNSLNVFEFMNPWVAQPGYPILNVQVSEDRKVVKISQQRFFRNNHEHTDKTLWNIPITFASKNHNEDFKNTKATVFLTRESLEIHSENPYDWIVFNVQQTGFYRVKYDDASWTAIGKVLHDSLNKIHVLNRAQIVDDALNLARAHQLSYSQALHTIEYLRAETEYVPWLSAFNNFDFILNRFKQEEAPLFKKFILDLLNTVYAHLGFEPKTDDTRLDIYNRNNVLKYACKFGHKDCVSKARAEYNKLETGGYTIPVNLVPVVYCSVVSEGSDKEWDFLWNKFQKENVAAEQVTILGALGCTKQADLIKRYFEHILSDKIRLQDKHSALVATLNQQENLGLVLDFVVTRHNDINTAFESKKEVPAILSQVAARATTKEQIEKIEMFAKENELGSHKSLSAALANAKANLLWAEHNIPSIKSYLETKYPSNATTKTVSLFILFIVALVSVFNY